MPIDKKSFELAKDPSNVLLEFLEKFPNQAFSLEEIIKGIPEITELQIPTETVKRSLDYLSRYPNFKIETAWLKGNAYYKIATA